MPSAEQQPQETRELVERYHVCWEVSPEYAFINHEKRQIGFELDLSGTHEGGTGTGHPEPGCQECHQIYQALVRIAKEVLPRENKDATYQFEPYDQGIRYSPRRGNRPEVVLRVRILHRRALEQPVDATEFQGLEELQRRLEERGIGQH